MQRLTRVNQTLEEEIGILEVQSQIQNKAREEMSKTQRDYYLREQLRQIKSEARRRRRPRRGDGRAARHGPRRPACPRRRAPRRRSEVRRLDQMHAESAEAAVLRTYVDWIVELPWNTASEDTLDIDAARRILDEDHYDLEHIKDRILDYLAVRKLRAGAHGPITLLYLGPPWRGRKLSLKKGARSARSRPQVRAHLAGRRARRGRDPRPPPHLRRRDAQPPHQGAWAGGHEQPRDPARRRRGRRKLGADNRGDPSAALLEVLDPEAEPTPSATTTWGVNFDHVEDHVHRHGEPAGDDPAAPLPVLAWRRCASPATAKKRRWSSPSATSCPSRSPRRG